MKIVSNSSVLISLSVIKKFNLLRSIFGKIYIPEGVYKEVVIEGKGKYGSTETKKALTEWIEVKKINNPTNVKLMNDLGMGEAEAITLALELATDFLLIDEIRARRKAMSLGIKVIGTLGVLKIAQKQGLITNLKKFVDILRKEQFRFDDKIYQEILKI